MFVAPAVCRRCSGESAQSTTTTGTAGLETRQKIYRPEARRETRGFVLHRTTHYRQLVVTPVNDDFAFDGKGRGLVSMKITLGLPIRPQYLCNCHQMCCILCLYFSLFSKRHCLPVA